MEEKSSKILQSYLVSPVPAESLKKMKNEENEIIDIHIYVKILARTGERSYFYQIFMRRKQAIPLQGSELFYKAEKKYRWRLFVLPRYVVVKKQQFKICVTRIIYYYFFSNSPFDLKFSSFKIFLFFYCSVKQQISCQLVSSYIPPDYVFC